MALRDWFRRKRAPVAAVDPTPAGHVRVEGVTRGRLYRPVEEAPVVPTGVATAKTIVRARVLRADGTVEDLGVIAED